MPILSDLLPFIGAESAYIPVARKLIENLESYCDPAAFGKLFNGFTNVNLDARFIVFNLQGIGEDEDELRGVRLMQLIHHLWDTLRAQRQKVMLVIDELGDMLESFPDVGNFVRRLYQRGRYFGLSVMGIVQNLGSILGIRAASICMENSGRIIVLGMKNRKALIGVQEGVGLSDGQMALLKRAKPGEGLQVIYRRSGTVYLHVYYTQNTKLATLLDTRQKDLNEAAA